MIASNLPSCFRNKLILCITWSHHWSKNIFCDLRVGFDWLRARFGKQLPQTNPRCFPACDAVLDSGPLERTIEAKWVRKQTWTGNMSSNGHLALPELIWRLVGWAYATETRRPDTHTHTYAHAPHARAAPLVLWLCHCSLETKPCRSFMH